MKALIHQPKILLIAALLAACATAPRSTTLLEQTRSDYLAAQQNPAVATYAASEWTQASEALALANAAANRAEDKAEIDKLAYLAKQKIAFSQEVAKRKAAEAEVIASAKQRDQMRLDQRTQEADQAGQRADAAQAAKAHAEGQVVAAQDASSAAQMRSQHLQMQLDALAAQKTARGLVITFGDVMFGTDLSNLSSAGRQTAQKLVEVLQQNPERTVLIEGFTDSTGTAAYNQALSERRAGAVQSVLQEMGVASQRIRSRGYGEAHPVAANTSEANRQMNRRVEIILSDASGTISQR